MTEIAWDNCGKRCDDDLAECKKVWIVGESLLESRTGLLNLLEKVFRMCTDGLSRLN